MNKSSRDDSSQFEVVSQLEAGNDRAWGLATDANEGRFIAVAHFKSQQGIHVYDLLLNSQQQQEEKEEENAASSQQQEEKQSNDEHLKTIAKVDGIGSSWRIGVAISQEVDQNPKFLVSASRDCDELQVYRFIYNNNINNEQKTISSSCETHPSRTSSSSSFSSKNEESSMSSSSSSSTLLEPYCKIRPVNEPSDKNGDTNYASPIITIRFNPTNDFEIATASIDGAIRIFDIPKQGEKKYCDDDDDAALATATASSLIGKRKFYIPLKSGCRCFRYTMDGNYIIAADKSVTSTRNDVITVYFIDVKLGVILRTFEPTPVDNGAKEVVIEPFLTPRFFGVFSGRGMELFKFPNESEISLWKEKPCSGFELEGKKKEEEIEEIENGWNPQHYRHNSNNNNNDQQQTTTSSNNNTFIPHCRIQESSSCEEKDDIDDDEADSAMYKSLSFVHVDLDITGKILAVSEGSKFFLFSTETGKRLLYTQDFCSDILHTTWLTSVSFLGRNSDRILLGFSSTGRKDTCAVITNPILKMKWRHRMIFFACRENGKEESKFYEGLTQFRILNLCCCFCPYVF